MDSCSCGNPIHPLYGGSCEDCYAYRQGYGNYTDPTPRAVRKSQAKHRTTDGKGRGMEVPVYQMNNRR